MTDYKYLEAIYNVFRWQGGTIHQLAAATGMEVTWLLYPPEFVESPPSSASEFAYGCVDLIHKAREENTIIVKYITDRVAENYKGNESFWTAFIHYAKGLPA